MKCPGAKADSTISVGAVCIDGSAETLRPFGCQHSRADFKQKNESSHRSVMLACELNPFRDAEAGARKVAQVYTLIGKMRLSHLQIEPHRFRSSNVLLSDSGIRFLCRSAASFESLWLC